MTRSQELVASLKASPRDEGHLEALVRWFSRKGEWDGLYAALTELVGDTEDLETLEWYRAHLAQVLQRHIDTVEDPALGGALRLRLANLLAEHLGRREEAVVLIAEAFERHPSAQVLDRALAHLEQLGELRFAARLLRTRATAETDPDRAADLWLRLGYTLRSLGELARSLEAFHAAAGDTAPGRTAAREAEQLEALVTRAREALEEARAEDGPDPEARIRVGRMLLSLHPGDREGSDRLLEAFLAEPGREDLIPHLLDALSDAGRWEDLQEVLRARVEVATDPAERRELLVERFRIRLLRQGDREGTAALQEQIHRAAPGDRAVVATLAGFWAELGEWEAVSELYGQARRLAGSREEENAFLEAEAVLAWQRMGDHERAEKLFRRIRSVDPKNTTCLRFYEDYYESQEDWRKLFTTLSTRQGLVPDAEKPALLLRMAVLADERIAAPDRAIDALKKVLMLDPGIAAASERLQAIYRREGKWHALVDFLDGQVARLGEERTAEKVGLLWEVHGIYSAADRQPIPEMELATLKRIVQVDPGETRALGLLAEVYRESQRWSALAEVLQGLADHDPEPAARRTRLGELARLYAGPLRSPRKATATLEAILADDPGDGEAQEALTEIYRSGGMTEGLYSVLQSRLKGARGAARRELLDELARIALDRLKRPEEGLEYLEKLVAIDPGDEASRSRLQQLYTQLGRWETLAEHLERRLKATKQKEGRAEILESLGELYLDRLGDAARARAIYETLLELNPRARGARESLRRLLVLERDWEALRGFFQDGEDWSGYLQLLEEAWRRADEPALVRDIGWELIRGAEDLLRDPERGLGYLSRMLERLPEDVSVARGLLERSDRCPAAVRVSALAVLADAGAGAEAEDAASALADLLESTGEPAGAHVRTLALLVQRLARGDAGLLERAVERAEAADALAELVAAVEGLLPDLPDRRVAEAVTVRLAAVYRERLRDLAGATRLLEAAQAEDGAAFPILEALERTRLAAGDLEALEAVLARLVEVAPSQEQRREKLLTLARLHEDVLAAPDRAYADYRLLVEHVPGDPEGYQGMIRTLEQQGDTAGLVEVLEELLSLVRDPEERRGLMLRIARLSWAELGAGPAAAEWCRRIVEGTPDDPDAVRLARDIFDAGEAPELLIPILRDTYERSHAWSDLVEVLHAEAGLAAEPAERGALLLRAAELLETKLQRLDEAYETLVRCVILEAGDEALRQRAEDLAERTDRLPAFAELLAGLAGVGDHPTPLEMPLEDDAALRVCDRLAALAGDRLGDDGLAARALRRGLELDPDRRDLVDRLAAVLRRTEQWSPLLDLLRDGERLLFAEEERKACHLEIAAILAERLGDDAGAIPWLESAFLLDEADRDVSARLEEAYTRHGRWADLASLLRSRLALLPREERGATAFQLAQMLKDRLEDLGAAVELLEGLLEASDTNRDAAVAALEDILSCTHAGDYETAAPRAASRIAPILEAAGEWERLVRVLRAQAAVAEDPAEQARHCMDLAAILEDRLEQASEAFDATAEALRRTPERREVVEALQQRAILADREDDLVALLREAIGDPATAPSPWAPGVLADILQSRGEEPETVAALLERLVELEPSAIGYHRRLADTYELLGQPDDRIRVLEGMIPHVEDVEEQADALLLLGELLLERGRTAEAADVLRRLTGRVAGHLTDRDRRAFTRLEEILEGEENWFDLEGLVRRRAALAEDDREKIEALYRAAALQEEHLDNPDAAIQGYRLIGELDPREGPAAESLERLFRATGRFEDLAELYRARLERDDGPPRGAQDMFRLARVLVDPLARPEEALAQLVRLLEREPGHAGAAELLERLVAEHPSVAYLSTVQLEAWYARAGDWSHLAEILRTQIDRFPDEIAVVEKYRALAELYETRLDDVDGAFLYMSHAFRQDPGSEAIHDRLLGYAERRGAWDQLFDLYLDVLMELETAAERNGLRRKMAKLFHDTLGDLERAEMLYRDILDDDPRDDFACERLTDLYRGTEEWEKLADVLRQAERVAEGKTRRVRLLFEISRICSERLGAGGEAMDALESVLSLDPKSWDAYRALETLHFSAGDIDGAVAVLRRELAVTEAPAARGETRLRLATLLALEAGDVSAALDQLEEARREGVVAEGTVELLQDLRERLDTVDERYVELLAALHREAKDTDRVIELFQWAAARAGDGAARMAWFERIYQVRTGEQDNDQGAYAVTKIMLRLDPAWPELPERLFLHAEAAGAEEDLAGFLDGVLSDGDAVLPEDLDVRLRRELARLLQVRLARPADAAVQWEALRGALDGGTAAEARAALEGIYRDLGEWAPYAAVLREEADRGTDPQRAREALLEAARVLEEPLGRFADAAEACRLLVDRFPDDEEILDRYEELLLRGEDAEALEGLLRHRIDVTPGAEARNEVRLRLAAVLLDAPGRLPEGIGELQTILAGEAAHEGAMTRLEVLLDSGSLDEALQAEVGRTLLAHLPGDDPSPRRSRVLTALLQVATAPDERLELHRRYASTLVAAGDREAALFHAGRVLVLGPGVADAEEVVEALAATLGDWGTLRDLYLEAAEAGGLPALEARYVQKAAELTEVQIERPDDAAPLYRRVLSLDPLSATALDALERYHRGRDDPAELAGILETRAASADGSERGRLGMELAGLYRDRLGDTDAAKGWLRDLVSHPDVGGEAFDGLTAILQAAGDWEGVHDLLLDRLGCVEEPALRAALLGRTAAVEEQFLEAWDDAVARYRELLELDGDSLNAWNGLRRCYRQLGHHLDLAETDERLLELVEDEERDGLRRELAELFAGPLDDPMRGLGLVAAILEKDSEDPGARQLAEGVLERGGPPAAEAARLLDPLAEARGDWDALAAILAVRLEALGGGEPGAAMARRLARVRAERLGDAGGAMEVLAGVLAATPDREDLVEELLGIAARGDAWPDAAKHLEALVDLATTPARRAGLATRAARIWHEELGDGGRAGLWYGRALEDCPDDASVFAALERLLDGEGRYAELEELYETSLARAAPAARTGLLLKLGFLREGHRDDRAGALDAYREILQAEPRHEAAMARLDALLDDPVYRYGAAEILEPVYREAPFRGRLPRLLLATLGEVEGGFERSRILAEASALLRETGGDAGEALDLLLSAVGEGRFDPDTVLTPAAQLADALDRWLDLSDALEAVLARTAEEDVRADLLRRLALIYDQKVGSPGRAEQKLRALLALDPQDPFALASLARLLEEGGGAPEELLGLLDRLADAAPDPAARRDALLRLADRATASGAVEQELGALRRILEQEPDAGEVLDRLEARCRALGDWHGLVDVLERRAQQASGEEGIPHRLALARVLADSLGDRSRAIGVLEDLVSRWPSREDALRGLVGQLALAGDWRRVVDVLRDFASREDVPRKERLERLWEACDVARDRLMEVELAREVVEQILAVDPSSARAADARLALLDGASDVDQVMAACDRKLEAETDPGEKAELLVKSARALLAAGTDREDALARLEQALVLAPAHALARRTLIGIRLEQGDDAAAVAGYEALAEIDREARGEALLAAGRLWLERLGDPDRAAELLEGARKEGALDREGLALLDRALRDAGRWEDVILLLEEEQQAATKPGVRAELCRRIAEAYRDGLEDRDEYLHWMEEAHKAREDPEVAEELLLACETAGRRDRVAELLAWKAEHLRKHRKMKDLPALLVRLGGLLAELGRPEEALATYRRCEEVDASYLPNQLALARALVAAGDSDAASRIYQMLALRINELSEVEQKVEVFHSLARLALEQDNRTKAKQYLTRLLSIDRDHGPAKELLRTLG